jgi:hypothetical protein
MLEGRNLGMFMLFFWVAMIFYHFLQHLLLWKVMVLFLGFADAGDFAETAGGDKTRHLSSKIHDVLWKSEDG